MSDEESSEAALLRVSALRLEVELDLAHVKLEAAFKRIDELYKSDKISDALRGTLQLSAQLCAQREMSKAEKSFTLRGQASDWQMRMLEEERKHPTDPVRAAEIVAAIKSLIDLWK